MVFKGALAIFAKTPGLSPVKTRLAAEAGHAFAETFYRFSIQATEEIAMEAQKSLQNTLRPYWALAEKEALTHRRWKSFPALWTGAGSLGQRLHNVYHRLREGHDFVILMGADSPQLSPRLLTEAVKKLRKYPKACVIGPCPDGGFYLFAAAIPIPKNVWTHVTYSAKTTLQELTDQLKKYKIKTCLLSEQVDVDTVSDLKPLFKALQTKHPLLSGQQKLYRWLQTCCRALFFWAHPAVSGCDNIHSDKRNRLAFNQVNARV
jgi:rSAM/selenodomain-associated transferase 1